MKKKMPLLVLLGLTALGLSACSFSFHYEWSDSSTGEETTSATEEKPDPEPTSSSDTDVDPDPEPATSSTTEEEPDPDPDPDPEPEDKLVWSDEFDGTALDTSKWTCETGTGNNGWGNWEQQYYRAENATVGGGYLTITAKKESYGGMRYTSARLKTQGKFSFTYGKVEARMRLPGITGSWPAFWMLPENLFQGRGWPWNGEIDIMENRGNQPNQYLSTIHTGQENASEWWSTQNTSGDITLNSPVTDWHTYGVIWTADYFSFYYDDITTYMVTKDRWQSWSAYAGTSAPFNQNFFILLNLAIGGQFISQQLPDDSQLPCQMQVDYVRVYSL